MKIGFFDSGMGGLTILREVRKLMPAYEYVFFGDTANIPYGDKSEAEILTLTRSAVERLFEAGALLVVIACNTASSETLRKLQDTMLVGAYRDRRLLGVVIPTIETLVESGSKHALLIGTERTINSKKYERELEKHSSNIKLLSHATPELVPYIESGMIKEAEQALVNVLDVMAGKVDTIILGCTHYTVLKDLVRKRYQVQVISQDELIPQKLKRYLDHHGEITEQLTQGRTLDIFLSEETDQYKKLRSELLAV